MSARRHEYRNRARNRLDTAPLREFTARFATAEEIENWDKHVTANPNGGNMLQSAAYASVKNGSGWKVRFLVLENGASASYNLVLEKSFPLLGRLWYLIKAPLVRSSQRVVH
jgi:serine/alanine adding enzyme